MFKKNDAAMVTMMAKAMRDAGYSATEVAEALGIGGSKASGSKSSAKPKKATEKDPWLKYQPKKDADGNWNWKSYKASRNRYLKDNGFDYETVGWLSREDFAKAVKPFEDHFGAYVKKSAR